ncbi:MAG: TIGR00266 family protein [Actinomycetia bacterium]|nr:TIGR00266 family protein [Actinomycetes bacterium]
MQIEIKNSPSFAMAQVTLSGGEQVKAEAGAMVAMTPSVEIQTSTQGGMLKGLRRSVLGGESFFMNTFTANGAGGQVSFAPTLPGDIVTWPLTGQTVFLQSGAYLASSTGIDVDSKWGGAKTFFSSEGLFMLKCSGHGDVLVSSYGAIEARQLAAGERYTVDTGHMVGWSEQVQYSVRKVGNWKSTFLSGEGLVCDLTGPGIIYMQTRSPDDFVSWLVPKLPSAGN